MIKQFGTRIIFVIIGLLCLFYVICSYHFDGLQTVFGDTDAYPREIVPESIEMIDSNTVEYIFSIEDDSRYSRSIKFVSSHENIEVYCDDDLIFERYNKNITYFGRSPGTAINIIQLPVGVKTLKVDINNPFIEDKFNSHSFQYGNGLYFLGNVVVDSIAPTIISLFILFCGIVMFVFWMISKKKYEMNPAIYYFALFTTMLGFWSINETNLVMVLFSDRMSASIFGYLLLGLLVYPFLQFARNYLRLEKTFFFYLVVISTYVGVFLLTILHINGIVDFVESGVVFHMLLFISLIYVIYATFIQSKRGLQNSKVKASIIATLSLLIAAGFNAATYYEHGLQTKFFGKVGILIFILTLGIQTMSDSFVQINNGKKATFYKNLAYSDIMTDCYNRSAFEKMQNELQNCDNMGLIIFDLNELKKCNDTLGHTVGDKYIIDTAEIIKNVFEPVGNIYRIGGDEFCCILSKKPTQSIEVFLTRFRTMEQAYNDKSKEIKMHVAIGFAFFDGEADTFDEMLKRADKMMYENKQALKS